MKRNKVFIGLAALAFFVGAAGVYAWFRSDHAAAELFAPECVRYPNGTDKSFFYFYEAEDPDYWDRLDLNKEKVSQVSVLIGRQLDVDKGDVLLAAKVSSDGYVFTVQNLVEMYNVNDFQPSWFVRMNENEITAMTPFYKTRCLDTYPLYECDFTVRKAEPLSSYYRRFLDGRYCQKFLDAQNMYIAEQKKVYE